MLHAHYYMNHQDNTNWVNHPGSDHSHDRQSRVVIAVITGMSNIIVN